MVDAESTKSDGIPRGVLPDAVDDSFVYLFKACSSLRLTYEIKVAAFLAHQHERQLAQLPGGRGGRDRPGPADPRSARHR